MLKTRTTLSLAAIPAFVSVLSACAVADRLNIPIPAVISGKKEAAANEKPARIGEVIRASFDGNADDLLTAGLGKTGLAAAALPPFVDATKPTWTEMRRRTIYANYRAIVDMNPNGGFGTLYGPNVDANGKVTESEGKVAGVEYLAYADDGSGAKNVSMLVQIPGSFNQAKPCIVAGPSSGSRGVYGAIGSAGEWGLKKGCAVVYTDKGTGNGVQDLSEDLVVNLQGEVLDTRAAGKTAQFAADLLPGRLKTYTTENPHRFAIKHAHSQQNPERDWGRDVLTSIRFAFWALNEEYVKPNERGVKPVKFISDNTIVIASSVSNGGGASLRAAEIDTEGLIDGVAVAEPQVQPRMSRSIAIEQGEKKVKTFGKPLFDYASLANLLQPCAAYAAGSVGSPGQGFVVAAFAQNRCAALKAAGVLKAEDSAGQASEALGMLQDYGWLPESNILHASHYAFATSAIATTYAMSYSRSSVVDHLCGYSYAATDSKDGKPVVAAATTMAGLFANGNGIIPTGGINIVNQNAEGGPVVDGVSLSPNTKKQDFNIDGALCLRSLIVPVVGQTPSAVRSRQASDLKRGIEEVLASADLRGKPAIIVHGRSDALVPVNHSSRPYYALNQAIEGEKSNLKYIEVTNAQHFDAFISSPALPGLDTRFVPLHRYFVQAMDAMYNHLASKSPLPDSQVVKTKPRGGEAGKAPALTIENVPGFTTQAAAGSRIVFHQGTLLLAD